MNKVIQDIEALEEVVAQKLQRTGLDCMSTQDQALFCIAQAILKLALVHAGNNVENVKEVKRGYFGPG